MNTEEVNPHLTAKIGVSYVRHHRLVPDQLADLISSVHRAIGQVGQPPESEEVLTPAVSVRRSVHRDYVICLDCGYRGKTLTRHIATRHGLSRDECRQRWGLRSNHPLTVLSNCPAGATFSQPGLRKSVVGYGAPNENFVPVPRRSGDAPTNRDIKGEALG